MPPAASGSSGGLLSRVEYLSPPGVLLPRVYGMSASPLWLALRGPAAWQGTPSLAVCRLACHWLFPWPRVTFAISPDAGWPGSDQWPWSTAPATGLAGRLGRRSGSDPLGVVGFALSLFSRRCVSVCGVQGPLALAHRCARPVQPVCGVCGHLALVQRCARCVWHARGVDGFGGVPSPPFFPFFACLMLTCFCLCFCFVFFNKEKRKRGAPTLEAQAWAVGAAVQQRCVPCRGAHCWCLPYDYTPRVRPECHNVHGGGLLWVRLGVPLCLGYASGGATGRDSRVRWFMQVRRM